MARCSSCGNESDLDVYVCDNCGYQLKVERLEAIPFFRRPSQKWYKPDNQYKRVFKVINPLTTPKAFMDINHKKDRGGPRFITMINAFLIGLTALAVNWHIDIQRYSGVEIGRLHLTLRPFALEFNYAFVRWINNFVVFLCFFLFGILYFFLIFKLYNYAFSLSANFSVQLDGILAIRYNVKLKKSKLRDAISGKARVEKKAGIESDLVIDSKKQKKTLTKISQTGKDKIIHYAYAPLIVVNLISFIFVAIFLPSATIADTSGITAIEIQTALTPIWDWGWWFFLDLLQLIGIFWVAGTMSIAQREIGNTSTTRLLIGNAIMAFIIGFTTIMLRPTFGAGNWNLIQLFASNTG